ncbi:MAG: UDP-glucose/GDP-mannose dehydrogenase family protein [Fretibacterium sp.]|nr:UDP-glucose/GDP-mannose dehydrogenase family protein [Fretibacterium sp.]
MKLVVIGTGYVGLVTGVCLAKFGNRVVCVDTDASRVETLRGGKVPFYEPGIEEMMNRNVAEGRLSFATSAGEALAEGETAEVCFITVGTPSAPDGSADLSAVEGAARDVGRSLRGPLLVVVKSTVPVGTHERVKAWVSEELKKRGQEPEFLMVSNPEFLREGAALRDFLEPDRVVLGVESPEAAERMKSLYSFLDSGRLLFMDLRSAEMAKYASNAMLATRISFMNEMANICERVGADVDHVRRAMGRDSRIGPSFLYAGCGYGGSCFPKDVRALRDFASASGYHPRILNAVEEVNENQKDVVFEKLALHLGDLSDKTVAIWGLSFKPKTSDVREAPAHRLILSLLEARARVQAHDPRAIEETRSALGDHRGLLYMHDLYDAVNGADALAVMTEWDIYRQPDLLRVRKLLKNPLMVDGRNLYSLAEMQRLGFDYLSIGRPSILGAGS